MIFLLLLIGNSSFAQSSVSKNLDSITKFYLHTMYIEKDFQKASRLWDTIKLLETYRHDLSAQQNKESDTEILTIINSKFISGLKKIKGFIFLDSFEISESRPNDNLRQVFITFYYTVAGSCKTPCNSGVLVLCSKDCGGSWQILDISALSY